MTPVTDSLNKHHILRKVILILFTIIMSLAFFTNKLFGQAPGSGKDNITLNADSPSTTQVTVGKSCQNPGINNYYYWVIVNYASGNSAPSSPSLITGMGTLAPTCTAFLSWQARDLATGYQILRTTVSFLPSSGSGNLLLATVSPSTTTYTDNGSVSPSAYTITTANQATWRMKLDNIGYPLPTITYTSFPVTPTYVGTGIPTIPCVIAQEFFQTDATPGNNKWLCTSTNVWTQLTGGGGGGSTQCATSINAGTLVVDSTPCNVSISGVLNVLGGDAVFTPGVGTAGTAYLYILDGVWTVGHNLASGSCNAFCTATSGVTTWPTRAVLVAVAVVGGGAVTSVVNRLQYPTVTLLEDGSNVTTSRDPITGNIIVNATGGGSASTDPGYLTSSEFSENWCSLEDPSVIRYGNIRYGTFVGGGNISTIGGYITSILSIKHPCGLALEANASNRLVLSTGNGYGARQFFNLGAALTAGDIVDRTMWVYIPDLTNIIVWSGWGVGNGLPAGGNLPTTTSILFRFSSSAADTTFKFVTHNGAASTVTASTVTVVNNKWFQLRFYTGTTPGTYTFQVNNETPISVSTNITNGPFNDVISTESLTGAVRRTYWDGPGYKLKPVSGVRYDP